MRRPALIAVAASMLGVAAEAAAVPVAPASPLARLVDEVERALAASARPSPVQRPVRWRPQRLVGLDLEAPLLAIAAGDLDGDRRAELALLTTREVVAVRPEAGGFIELGRAPVPAAVPVQEPRFAVAAASIGGGEIWARVSSSARGARYALAAEGLREVAAASGFPFCPGASHELAFGRHTFAASDGSAWLAMRCRDDLVLKGRRISARAVLGTDQTLRVSLSASCDGAPCRIQDVPVAGVGTAFDLADLDGDGVLEVVFAGAGAPGDADAVAVRSLTAAGLAGKPRFRRGFAAGVIGLVVADLDGDGDLEGIAAVKSSDAIGQADLWQLF